MPKTEVVFYCDDDGGAPVLVWLGELPERARAKCLALVELLGASGHELRRPLADSLRDGVHELRARAGRVHYRVLYSFHTRVDGPKAAEKGRPKAVKKGTTVAVLTHGIVKEGKVPDADIDRAIARMAKFEADPKRHTWEE